MPTDPLEFIDQICIFHCRAQDDLCSKAQVVAWADEFIRKDDEPDAFFIDLCMARDYTTKNRYYWPEFDQKISDHLK